MIGATRKRLFILVTFVVYLASQAFASDLILSGDGGLLRLDGEAGELREIISNEPGFFSEWFSVFQVDLETGGMPDRFGVPPGIAFGIAGALLATDSGTIPALVRLDGDDRSLTGFPLGDLPSDPELIQPTDGAAGENGQPIKPVSFPFFSSLGESFDEPLNRMWRIYGSVSDGTDAVIKFGNEPAFFEWMARKLMWTDEWNYREGLLSRIRGYPMSANGYVWSWGNRPDWPTDPGALHQENNAKYILSLYRYFMWTRDPRFLKTLDNTTTISVSGHHDVDVSEGMTLLEKLRLAMDYQLTELSGGDGLLVIKNNHNTGLTDGAPTNYWDNFPFGYKDAYSNAYFYASVLAMAEIEEFVGGTAAAVFYRELATGIWRRYTEEFWDVQKGRFVGTIDEAGQIWDLGFTFLNTEALVYGLGGQREADAIFSWLDGDRIVETDTSRGSDIYTFRWAPRATTVDVASLGQPYWWKSINNQITVGPGGSATFGEHLENGGAIFYTSHYDILARAQYRGANDAWDRLGAIMDEFGVDELRRNPPNNVGARWKFGIIGVFPESGLVPASYLYAFLGIDADLRGLNIRPNLPEALEYGGIRNLAFGDGLYQVTVWPGRVELEPLQANDRRLIGVAGNFPENTAYRLVVRDLATGEESVTLQTTTASGDFHFDLTVKRGVVVTIEPVTK